MEPTTMDATGAGKIRRSMIFSLALFAPVLHVVGAGGAQVKIGATDPLVWAVIPWILWRFLSRHARLPLLLGCCAMATVTLISVLSRFEIGFYTRNPLGLSAAIVKALFIWAYFYVTVNLLESSSDLLLMIRTWIAGSGLLALCGIVASVAHQMLNIETRFALAYRAQGTMGDPNLFSTHLGVSFFLALLYMNLIGRKPRWVLLVMVLQLGGMIMSASRSGLLGFLAGLGLLLVFRAPVKWKVATVTALLCAVITAASVPSVRHKLTSNPVSDRLATTTVDVRETDRIKLWHLAWGNFVQYPIFGVGYDNGTFVNRSVAGHAGEAHNTYLSIASELGIAGIAIFAVTLAYFPTVLLYSGKGFPDKQTAAWLLVAAFTNIAVVGMAMNAENYRGLWMLMGVAYWFRLLYMPAVKHRDEVEYVVAA